MPFEMQSLVSNFNFVKFIIIIFLESPGDLPFFLSY